MGPVVETSSFEPISPVAHSKRQPVPQPLHERQSMGMSGMGAPYGGCDSSNVHRSQHQNLQSNAPPVTSVDTSGVFSVRNSAADSQILKSPRKMQSTNLNKAAETCGVSLVTLKLSRIEVITLLVYYTNHSDSDKLKNGNRKVIEYNCEHSIKIMYWQLRVEREIWEILHILLILRADCSFHRRSKEAENFL